MSSGCNNGYMTGMCSSGSCGGCDCMGNPRQSCYVPPPKYCSNTRAIPAGRDGTRYAYLGAYVPNEQYVQGCVGGQLPPGLATCYSATDSLAARSYLSKQPRPGERGGCCSAMYPFGLSSQDYAMPSLSGACAYGVSAFNPCAPQVPSCDPCRIKPSSCSPFDDVLLDCPVDVATADYAMTRDGNLTFVTTNFNQSWDLRGDLSPGYCGAPAGAGLSSHGPCTLANAWRGWTY